MPKVNPADEEAIINYSTQVRLSRNRSSRVTGIFLLSLLFVFISVFGILVWTLPHNDFSENENRMLQTIPEFSFSELNNGRFTKQLSDFYSDRFPFRDLFISTHSYTELALLRREANGVIYGSDNALAERLVLTSANMKNYQSVSEAINNLSTEFESNGLDCTVAVVPTAADILRNKLPSVFVPFNIIMPEGSIDLSACLKEENSWFKTDHHWTAYGAFLAYKELGSTLGYTPYSIENFTFETVSESFYGTTWSKSGLYLTPPESFMLMRYSDDNNYTITGDLEQNGFYDESKLNEKDKYAVFLGGNHGHITIQGSGEKPRLLLIKDSFANALIPFLARHFELEVVDPRYFSGNIYEISESCNSVLFLYGIGSLITDHDIIRLTFN